jgi:hypothetical protein
MLKKKTPRKGLSHGVAHCQPARKVLETLTIFATRQPYDRAMPDEEPYGGVERLCAAKVRLRGLVLTIL